jgi:hypothetical protein
LKKPELPQEGPDRTRTVQIFVAVLGLIGVVGGAFISNWDKIFTKGPDKSFQRSYEVIPQTTRQNTAGSQSPAISHVTGDVTLNFGAQDTRAPKKKPLDLTGIWTARLACCPSWTSQSMQNYVFDLETDDNGEIEGTALASDETTRPILKGRIRDNRIYFETVWKDRPGTIGTQRYVADTTTVFRGKVYGNKIDFTMILDNGVTVPFTATKQSRTGQ